VFADLRTCFCQAFVGHFLKLSSLGAACVWVVRIREAVELLHPAHNLAPQRLSSLNEVRMLCTFTFVVVGAYTACAPLNRIGEVVYHSESLLWVLLSIAASSFVFMVYSCKLFPGYFISKEILVIVQWVFKLFAKKVE
jgi:hypothetical protein